MLGGGFAAMVVVILLAATYFAAGSTASSFKNDVSEYVGRSDSFLKGEDYKNNDKVQNLIKTAPDLTWVPLGSLNGDYKKAQAQRDALDYYTAKTVSVTTSQQDVTLRDNLTNAMTAIMKQYSDAADNI